MDPAFRVRTAFAAGFAILLGIGIAAVRQSFLWEESVNAVSGISSVLNEVDSAAIASQSVHIEAHRFVRDGDTDAYRRCLADLDRLRKLAASISASQLSSITQNTEFHARGGRLAALIEEQDVIIRAIMRSPATALAAMDVRDKSASRVQLTEAFLGFQGELRRVLDERLRSQAGIATRSRRLFVTWGLLCVLLIVMTGRKFSFDLENRGKSGREGVKKNEFYRQSVELATDMVVRLDDQGRFVYCNPAALALLHYSLDEVIGRSYTRMVRLDMRREVEHFYMLQTARRRKSSYHEFPILDGHGRERWIGLNVQVLISADGTGRVTGFQAIAREITERRRSELELARTVNLLEGIAATTPGILYVFDLVERKTVFANREMQEVLGYPAEPSANFDRLAARLFHPDDISALNAHYESLRRCREGAVHRIEYRARHFDGNWIWLSAWESPFKWDQDGRVRQVVGVAQDVTVHNAAREKLPWQANFDTLTRLSNRQHFWSALQATLRKASMEQATVSLCLFDLDYFKEINDRFGHTAGDEVLEALGEIVRSEMRSDDASGRLGGDEFGFVLQNADPEEAARVADRVRERLNTMAFGMSGGAAFSASATFGIAKWHPDMGARELMDAADRALYRAKASGRNCVALEA